MRKKFTHEKEEHFQESSGIGIGKIVEALEIRVTRLRSELQRFQNQLIH